MACWSSSDSVGAFAEDCLAMEDFEACVAGAWVSFCCPDVSMAAKGTDRRARSTCAGASCCHRRLIGRILNCFYGNCRTEGMRQGGVGKKRKFLARWEPQKRELGSRTPCDYCAPWTSMAPETV